MKKILYSNLNSVGNILDSYIQNENVALKNAMKNATLFKFWGKVVGKKFEKVSKPVSISHKPDATILNVACASASVTSELMLYKNQLTKKLNTYSKPLGIEIDDMNFSHKIWQTETQTQSDYERKTKILEENPYKEDLTGYDADTIELNEEEISAIKANISQNPALSEAQKSRLLASIIQDIKIRKFLDKK